MKKKAGNAAAIPWVQILVVVSLLAFLVYVFLVVPNMTEDQRAIVRFLMALLGGFSAYFIGGSVILHLRFFVNEHARILFSATAGIAVFALLYLVAPYWDKRDREGRSDRTAPAETPSPPASSSPTPSPSAPAASRSSPSPSPIQSSPRPTPTLIPATPASAVPTPAPFNKRGRVLVLIEEDAFAQAFAQQLSEGGVEVVTGAELSPADRLGIARALPLLRNGDLSAGGSIPYAIIVTGRISITQLGAPDGIHRGEASGSLTAINTANGQSHARSLPPIRSGGASAEAARSNVLREASQNIPPFFINQVILDAMR